MIISALFVIAALARLPTRAKVVEHFDECKAFFYENAEPQGMDQNSKKICQTYDSRYFYASLYSTSHRIPVYTAYTYDSSCSKEGRQKTGNWFIEPQLAGLPEDTMQPETSDNHDTIKPNQAVNDDYSNTGYDRGQLNPNRFQCGDGRTATFTLTNSAPMDAYFNRVHWYRLEKAVNYILSVVTKTGTAYLVTGTVPSPDLRIPRRGEFDDPGAREFNRVTVPTHIWTAVCYEDNLNNNLSFSFGYIGLNQPDSRISVKTVPKLNHQLARLYGTAKVKIFKDDCFSTKMESEKMVKQLDKIIQLPISDRRDMSDDILNVFYSSINQFDDNEQSTTKKSTVTEVNMCETRDCLETWFKETERMKHVSGLAERLLSGKDITVNGKLCNSDSYCGTHGYKYYWCWVGNSWDYCSPPPPIGKGYEGKRCRSDYNCGFYGNSYTWCHTDYTNWDHCCRDGDNPFSALNGRTCRPNHPCGYYGYKYRWCHTTDGTWDYCCTSSADSSPTSPNSEL